MIYISFGCWSFGFHYMCIYTQAKRRDSILLFRPQPWNVHYNSITTTSGEHTKFFNQRTTHCSGLLEKLKNFQLCQSQSQPYLIRCGFLSFLEDLNSLGFYFPLKPCVWAAHCWTDYELRQMSYQTFTALELRLQTYLSL